MPGDLTIGEQQRVGIARGLMLQPDVIVFDEPTSMLDPMSRYEVLRLLRPLRDERQATLLFITHDLKAVQYLCDDVVVMSLGEIVEQGPTERIFAAPRHPYTRALVSSMLEVERMGDLPAFTLEGEIPSAVNLPAGCCFRSRCPRVIGACASHPMLVGDEEGGAVRCFNPVLATATTPEQPVEMSAPR